MSQSSKSTKDVPLGYCKIGYSERLGKVADDHAQGSSVNIAAQAHSTELISPALKQFERAHVGNEYDMDKELARWILASFSCL